MQPGGPPPTHPIDHGWAWMVCLGASVANFFVNGGTRSMGMLLVELIVRFEAAPSVAAIALGLVAAGFAIFAALGNGFGVVLTNRLVALTGAISMFISMIVTAFAPNIIVVIVFFGIFSGIGYGFMFGPSMVSVGQYFQKRRSLANGLAVAGGSIGQLVLPQFLNYVTGEYGFQGALLIYSGLILHAIPGAMLLRPPQFYNRGKKAAEIRRAMAAEEEQKNNNVQDTPEEDSLIEDEDKQDMYGSRCSLDHLHMQEPPKVDEVSVAEEESPPEAPKPPRPSVCGICALILIKLFDKTLLCSLVFMCVAIGVSLGHGGYLNILFLVPAYCVELFDKVIGKQRGALILSIMGIADLVGRVLGGWFADLGLVSRPVIVGFSFVLCGTLSIIMPFFSSFPVLLGYSVVYGLLGGTYMALLAVIIVDLFGLPMLASGMGLSTMIMGLAIIPMPTIMSLIRSAFGTSGAPIRVCGAMLIAGGLIYLCIPFAKKFMDSRKNKAKPADMVDSEAQVKPSDFFETNERCRLSVAEKESHI